MTAVTSAVLVTLGDTAKAPAWVQLFAGRQVEARDGRRWTLEDAAGVVTRSIARAGKTPLAIDYEHQAQRAEKNGQPAPAAGWIETLEARDGGIWAKVQWTARAATHIAEREYRFISPTFFEDGKGGVGIIIGAGLTNQPALDLVALAKAKDPEMDPAIEAALAALRSLYGLPETAQPDAIVEAAKTRLSTAAAGVDPTRFVPIETFETVVAQLNVASRGMSDEAAVIAVDREIAAGRLVPSMRDWGVSLCRQNKPAFDGFLERTAGGLQHLFAKDQRGAPPTSTTAIDADIARNLGLSADDLKAAQ